VNREPRLKEKYTIARCCLPAREQEIVGYFSFDDFIKVHRSDCANLAKVDPTRLVALEWDDILSDPEPGPVAETEELDEIDIAILRHHRDYDIDYSLKVARVLGIERQAAFERHQKLRNLGLLERVEALMVRYRKNITRNKWIKHRNHTYYRLTAKGSACLVGDESTGARENEAD